MTASMRSRVGVFAGVGLAILALCLCALPWIPATRSALRISGVWLDPSSYYFGSFVSAATGVTVTTTFVKRGELKAWRIVALSLATVGALVALAALALAALISFGMSS